MAEPDANAQPSAAEVSARPPLVVVGTSADDVDALSKALRMLGLSSLEVSHLSRISAGGDMEIRPPTRDLARAAFFVVGDPLESASELERTTGVDGPVALAVWERCQRAGLKGLEGQPVFVTSRASALSDPGGWSSSVTDFLSRHGMATTGDPPPSQIAAVLGRGREDDGTHKDEGLVLDSQQQLAALLERLLGAHDSFDPPSPEPESPWVGAVLDLRRDLDQVWKGLDWATEQLASFLPSHRDRSSVVGASLSGSPQDTEDRYPLNASEDLPAYRRWLERRREPTVLPLSGGLPAARARAHVTSQPLFTVVVPVYRPPAWALERCVASVLGQSFHGFQLVLSDDASGDAALEDQLRSFARLDPRVEIVLRTENGGISAATNSAIERARGEHLVFLDDDDELHPRALEQMASAISDNPEADVLYSDEDKIDRSGGLCVPTLKPGWSPDLLLSCAYLCHLLVVRRSLVEQLGGLRSEFDGGQDYDLMLRATEVARAVVHVPEILYHWRVIAGSASGDTSAKPWAFDAGRRALEDALVRRGIEAAVEPHEAFVGNFHVRRSVLGEPLVSIVMPFRDEPALTAKCYRSLIRAPGHENFEVLLIDNGSELPETRALLGELADEPKVRIVRDPRAFNWVTINNAAATEARGEVLLFVNNDVEACSDGWLAAMLGHAQRLDVGAVGALLRYPDLTVQHAGIVLALTWGAGHVQQGVPFNHPSYLLMADITRNCSAVTGACLMTRRSCFEELGGFDTGLPVAFNDVDYCLRARKRGLLVVFTPLAELIHHESRTRGHSEDVVETPFFRARWRDEILAGDPYYNPNLTHFDPYCRLSTDEERDLWSHFRSMLEASSTS